MPGVTDTFGLGVQNEPGQSLTEFCQENANTILEQHNRWFYTWASPDGQYQVWIDYIDYIITAKIEEVLYSHKKQDQELTVAQIISLLLQNSGLNWRK